MVVHNRWRVLREFEEGLVEVENGVGHRHFLQTQKCVRCDGKVISGKVVDLRYVCGRCQRSDADRRQLEKKSRDLIASKKFRDARAAAAFKEGMLPYQRRLCRVSAATPLWVDKAEIRAIYAEARRVSKMSGVVHHVDHIYPVTSILGCGLHVPANLRVIPRSSNCSKSNGFPLVHSPAWGNLTSVEIEVEMLAMVREYEERYPKSVCKRFKYMMPLDKRANYATDQA